MPINPLAAAILANTQSPNNAAGKINQQMNNIGKPLETTTTIPNEGLDISSLLTMLMMMFMGKDSDNGNDATAAMGLKQLPANKGLDFRKLLLLAGDGSQVDRPGIFD